MSPSFGFTLPPAHGITPNPGSIKPHVSLVILLQLITSFVQVSQFFVEVIMDSLF